MSAILVGLVGRSGSGKDEIGRYLASRRGFQRVAFADVLKEATATLFGLSREQLWGTGRNEPDERWGLTPRQLYQQLGDAAREIHEQTLLIGGMARCKDLLQAGTHVVVTDVRMLAEAAAVRSGGGVILRVRRERSHEFLGSSHETEVESDQIVEDQIVENNGSLADLGRAVDAVLHYRYSLSNSPNLFSNSPTTSPGPATAASPPSPSTTPNR